MQQSLYGREIVKALESDARTAPGKMAPNFTRQDTTGKHLTLSRLRGRYVLVDFWASWCGFCRKENLNVVAAYNKFQEKRFDIMISSGFPWIIRRGMDQGHQGRRPYLVSCV